MVRGFLIILWCLLWGSAKANAADPIMVNKGKQLYLSYGCALCHGREGDGKGINGQKYNPPPTNFHDPQAYMHGHEREGIRSSIHNGIKEDNSIMPAFEDIPTDELDEIIAYLQSLQRKDR